MKNERSAGSTGNGKQEGRPDPHRPVQFEVGTLPVAKTARFYGRENGPAAAPQDGRPHDDAGHRHNHYHHAGRPHHDLAGASGQQRGMHFEKLMRERLALPSRAEHSGGVRVDVDLQRILAPHHDLDGFVRRAWQFDAGNRRISEGNARRTESRTGRDPRALSAHQQQLGVQCPIDFIPKNKGAAGDASHHEHRPGDRCAEQVQAAGKNMQRGHAPQ